MATEDCGGMENASVRPYILLADQGTALQGALAPFLDTAGWKYDCVSDGMAALQAASNGDYDLVLIDSFIPDINCLEFLRSIRARRPEQAVVMVLREEQCCNTDELIQAGALDCLQFPGDFGSLQNLMERIGEWLAPKEVDPQLYQFVSSENSSWEFESSELGDFVPPLPILDRLHSSGKIDRSSRLKLLLAFQEAFANGLEHGNLELQSSLKEEINADGIDLYTIKRRERLSDPHYAKRKLYISTEYNGSQLVIKIRDEGKGFLHDQADVFDLKKNNQSCYGRGLAMINSSVDQAYYQEGGRQLVMVKNIVAV